MEQSSSGGNETNLHRFDSYCKKILKNEAITTLSTRTLYDEKGVPHICVDEGIRRRLQTKLIAAVLNFKIA